MSVFNPGMGGGNLEMGQFPRTSEFDNGQRIGRLEAYQLNERLRLEQLIRYFVSQGMDPVEAHTFVYRFATIPVQSVGQEFADHIAEDWTRKWTMHHRLKKGLGRLDEESAMRYNDELDRKDLHSRSNRLMHDILKAERETSVPPVKDMKQQVQAVSEKVDTHPKFHFKNQQIMEDAKSADPTFVFEKLVDDMIDSEAFRDAPLAVRETFMMAKIIAKLLRIEYSL